MKKLLFTCKYNVQNHVSKKNSRPIRRSKRSNKPFLGKSAKLVGAEYQNALKLQFYRNKQMLEPISSNCDMQITIGFNKNHFVTKKNSINLKRGDTTNLVEIYQDSLEKAGIIKNDALILNVDVKIGYTEQMPFVEIKLFAINSIDDYNLDKC